MERETEAGVRRRDETATLKKKTQLPDDPLLTTRDGRMPLPGVLRDGNLSSFKSQVAARAPNRAIPYLY